MDGRLKGLALVEDVGKQRAQAAGERLVDTGYVVDLGERGLTLTLLPLVLDLQYWVVGLVLGLAYEEQRIEQKFGRDRSLEVRNGPRSLDIDIELFGNQTVKKENLVIPHERLLERAFVLAPFLEVLQKNADVNKADIEFYGKKLELLKDQRVEKYCSF